MSRFNKPLGIAAITGFCLLSFSASQVFAQYRVFYPTYSSGYWGYSSDPYGLHGAADVIRSQGEFIINVQKANQEREKVRQMKVESRRKELDQWLWERQNLPTWNDERERYQREILRRSRNDPPITEIWSGTALNALLADAKKIQSEGYQSASSPLNEDLLAQINVTTGKKGGNIGVLKSDRLNWPLLLRKSFFKNDREQLDEALKQIIKEAKGGRLDADSLFESMSRLTNLQKELTKFVRTSRDDEGWTYSMYSDAKNYLSELADGIRVLQQPDAVSYLTGKYAAKGKTVAELVKHMTENGLQFAPASPGNESAYTALHRALATYDKGGSAQFEGERPK